jgi:hypothetical protein
MKWWSLLFCVSCLTVASSPASAHRPYYTQVEKILLPNGQIGELRLLNGDGILGPDPVRAVIVSPQGRLLAISSKTHSMAISCDDDRHCLIVDLMSDRVFELDPRTFRDGAVQPAISPGDRTDDWDLEAETESWGFVTRPAGVAELSAANWALAHEIYGALIFSAILGALGGICLVPIRLSIRSRRLRLLAQAVTILGGLSVLLAFAAFSLAMVVMGGGSMKLSLSAFALGAGLAWVATTIVKRRFPRPYNGGLST